MSTFSCAASRGGFIVRLLERLFDMSTEGVNRETGGEVLINKFRMSRSLSRMVIGYRDATGETLTGACLSLIRRGIMAPLESETARLNAVLAQGAIDDGRPADAVKYLRAIIDSGTIAASISIPRGADETSNDLDRGD